MKNKNEFESFWKKKIDFLKKMCYYTDEVIKMLSVERYNLILELIKQKKNIKLNEIVEE